MQSNQTVTAKFQSELDEDDKDQSSLLLLMDEAKTLQLKIRTFYKDQYKQHHEDTNVRLQHITLLS